MEHDTASSNTHTQQVFTVSRIPTPMSYLYMYTTHLQQDSSLAVYTVRLSKALSGSQVNTNKNAS